MLLALLFLAQTCFLAPLVTPISPTPGPVYTVSGSLLIKLDAVPQCPNRTVHVKVGIDLGSTFPPCSSIPANCVGEDTTAPGPYSVLMDTTRWVNGPHDVWVEAVDNQDGSSSYTLHLDIQNPATGTDAQPPEAFIQLPRDGFQLGNGQQSQVVVQGDYADNFGVTNVDLLVNGQLFATASAAPFDLLFTTKKHGTYNLQTCARDAAGNTGLSQVIQVVK